MNLPNLISITRLTMAPVLLGLAWLGYARTAIVILVMSFASDALDGYLARRLGQASQLGARLDSVGDFAIYMTVPLLAWWLWPDILRRESPYFIAVIASTILPPVIGYCKFRTLISYHTWAVKLAAFLVGGSVILLFAGGSPWLFRMVIPVSIYAGLEEIVITLVSPISRSNVKSFWHVMGPRLARAHREP